MQGGYISKVSESKESFSLLLLWVLIGKSAKGNNSSAERKVKRGLFCLFPPGSSTNFETFEWQFLFVGGDPHAIFPVKPDSKNSQGTASSPVCGWKLKERF